MTTYNPDYWLVVKVGKEEPLYKVFATWTGGYLSGDSWQMNSGIKSVEITGKKILFHGYSGSVYECNKNKEVYRTSMYSASVLESLKTFGTMEILSYEDVLSKEW